MYAFERGWGFVSPLPCPRLEGEEVNGIGDW